MKKLLTVDNLSSVGMSMDIEAWKLPVGGTTLLSNVRLENDHVMPFGGSVLYRHVEGVDHVIAYTTVQGSEYLTVDKVNDKVYKYQDINAKEDVTGQFKGGSAPYINHCRIGNVVVLNAFKPYFDLLPATGFTPLNWDALETWEDKNITANFIDSHGQYLFAWGLNENGTEFSNRVRWSSPADNNSIPETWDETDFTNVAGYVDLSGKGGRIIGGESLRDSFIVYRENGVHAFDYIGGTYVWKVRQVSDKIGLVSQRAVVSLNNIHYLIANGDIYAFDGRTFRSIALGRVKEYFMQVFASENSREAFVFANAYHDEVYFCIREQGFSKTGVPDPRSGLSDLEGVNVAFVYNYSLNSWSVRRFKERRTDGSIVGRMYSHLVRGGVTPVAQTWDALVFKETDPISKHVKWENISTRWENPALVSNAEQNVVALSPEDGGLYVISGHDFKTQRPEVHPAVIERIGLVPETIDEVTSATKAYLNFTGEGEVLIEFGDQAFPNSPVNWREKKLVNVATERKVDFRSTGRLHAYRLSGDSSANWKFTGMTIEYTYAGQR